MTDSATHHDYDAVPYPDMSHSSTHPDRLATIATLLGLEAAPLERCRVLELGCAGGWNLFPMAELLPESTFVGVDNSAVQIASARKSAEDTNIKNVEFFDMDILDISQDFGEFDYIIAHGVYSWVPDNVRDKVMQICKQNLAPQGVAYISYNAYPGWKMLIMVREMMLYHIRDLTDPLERGAKAIELVRFLSDNIPNSTTSAYKSFFEAYLSLRPWDQDNTKNLGSLLHDELESVNNPFYFHQFASHAAQHGLQYLADTNFSSAFPHRFKSDAVERLHQMSPTVIEMEQYLDFLQNRYFRRSLICHDDVVIKRNITPEIISKFTIMSPADQIESDNPNVAKFRGSDNVIFATEHPVSIEAFKYLIEIQPKAVSFPELFRESSKRLGVAPVPEDAQLLAAGLLQAYAYSPHLIELHVHNPDFVTHVSPMPVARPLARYQASVADEVTNMRHERVHLEAVSHALIDKLDGTHDRAALKEHMIGLVNDGRLKFKEGAVKLPSSIDAMLDEELDTALDLLAKTALLIG